MIMTRRERIGVFGGTFDPIHIGHLISGEEVRHRLRLDRLLFLPNREPPHKTDYSITPIQDRLAIVRLAIRPNRAFHLDLTEIERPGPSYAVDTLRELRRKLGDEGNLFFILGYDALLGLETWHEPDALLNECRLAVMDRPDPSGNGRKDDWERLERRFPGIRHRIEILHVPQIGVSSRDIRRRVAGGEPIRYQVPLDVEDYIRERGLYNTEV